MTDKKKLTTADGAPVPAGERVAAPGSDVQK